MKIESNGRSLVGPEIEGSAGDDRLQGILLSRKEALAVLAGVGTTLVGFSPPTSAEDGVASAPCVVLPEMTEGPFYVNSGLERSDIRASRPGGEPVPGALLALAFRVFELQGGGCVPLPGAVVDIWHCDAAGRYSGVRDRSGSTVSESFLRGFQVTDEGGRARFTTIYPGWYRGRAVHIHVKIRSAVSAAKGYEFASQLFFDDELSDRVQGVPPYTENGVRDKRNVQDSIFRAGGDQLTLDVTEKAGGYSAVLDIAIDVGRP